MQGVLLSDVGEEVHAEGLAMDSGNGHKPGTNDAAQPDAREGKQNTMNMDDLFSGVWMIEEDAHGVSDSGSSLAEVGTQSSCRAATWCRSCYLQSSPVQSFLPMKLHQLLGWCLADRMLNFVVDVQEDIHLQQADADGSVLGTMPNLPDSSEILGATGKQLVLWEDEVPMHGHH